MTRIDILNEHLDFMYLTEDAKTAIKKIDVDSLKKAVETKDKGKIKQALKSIPKMEIDKAKDIAMKKLKNFGKHYKFAIKGTDDKDPNRKKLSFAYAILKSLAELIPKATTFLNKQASKVLSYIRNNLGKITIEFSIGLVLIITVLYVLSVMASTATSILMSPMAFVAVFLLIAGFVGAIFTPRF